MTEDLLILNLSAVRMTSILSGERELLTGSPKEICEVRKHILRIMITSHLQYEGYHADGFLTQVNSDSRQLHLNHI